MVILPEIQSQIDICTWSVLQPHIEKSNLFVIAADFEFAEAALAIAGDEVGKVRSMLDAGHLYRITRECIEAWNQQPEKHFRMLVLKPYLLIQEVLAN